MFAEQQAGLGTMIHVSMLDLSSVIECIPLTKPLAEDEVRKTNFT